MSECRKRSSSSDGGVECLLDSEYSMERCTGRVYDVTVIDALQIGENIVEVDFEQTPGQLRWL